MQNVTVEWARQQVSLLQHPLNLAVVVGFLLFTYFLLKWPTSSPSAPKNLPPSPRKLPIIGNLHQLGTYPHRSLPPLARRYGDLMLLHFGSLPVLIMSSAEAAREVLKTNDLVFSNRPSKFATLDRLLYNRKDVASAEYGEYWRQMRSVYVLHLLSNKRVNSFRDVREEEVCLLLKKFEDCSSASLSVNLTEAFAVVTNDVICRTAFGRKYSGDERSQKFKWLMSEFMKLLGAFSVGDFIPSLSWVNRLSGFDARVDRTAKEFDKFLDDVVEERLKIRETTTVKEELKDFVDVLLELQKLNTLPGFSLERENIKALILDVLIGGTDTSSTVIEWAMSELIKNPRVMKELQKEVREIAQDEPYITETDLQKTKYLKLIITETIRLHPPFPLLGPRESMQDAKVMGYDIAAGTLAIANLWAIGRDPKYWTNPEQFWPERFLNSTIDFRGHDFELIPFGTGRRGCPGISFAMAVDELVLANVVRNFDWVLPNGVKGEDLDMAECTGLTMHRKDPLLAIPVRRSSNYNE